MMYIILQLKKNLLGALSAFCISLGPHEGLEGVWVFLPVAGGEAVDALRGTGGGTESRAGAREQKLLACHLVIFFSFPPVCDRP